ncbi:MAG: GDP-L-fucose synthase [Saprospiraceae bacterium]|nr:GDP-L-fucose synthase [Saprospiraceae bacterium]
MNKSSSIFVAGHRGMVGSAIVRILENEGYSNILKRTSSELDLRNQKEVNSFFEKEKPQFVFLAAAKVGGILANSQRKGEFLYDNLMIQNNVIHASYLNNVEKLLFLGSSCIYPKMAKQPMHEESLLTGPLEETNDAYAIAKIAGIKMCDSYRAQYGCNFISAMPTNLYGPNDNYDLHSSHVLPALLRKTVEAKNNQEEKIVVWGTGKPLREFLHVDDLAAACLFLMDSYEEPGHINVGTGDEVSILELVQLIKKVVGYEGDLVHDFSKPDGTPRKLMDNSKIQELGWNSKISLEEGVSIVYEDVKNQFQ